LPVAAGMSQRGGELWTADRALLRLDVLPLLVRIHTLFGQFHTKVEGVSDVAEHDFDQLVDNPVHGDTSFCGAFGEDSSTRAWMR